MRLAALVVLLALATTLLPVAPRVAVAAEPDQQTLEEAAARYDRGVKLYEQGDYPAALAEFEAVYKMTGRFEVLYNIGLCQKKLFRYGASVRSFEKYLAEGGAGVDPARKQAVEAELADIRSLVAEVTVTVPGAPAQIDVDGASEGQTPFDRPLLLPSGHHTLRASREGELPDDKAIDVVSGQKIEVQLEPKPRPVAPTTAKITIDSRPSGAAISLDGKPVGTAPWTGDLPAGSYHVTATQRGYTKAAQELLVVAGQPRRVVIELVPLPPPPAPPKPVYKKWWFWAGVGVAATAAGVFAGYELTKPPSYDNSVHFP
jgi:hypothetical protein